jgi:hypothetical protein
MNKQHRVLPVLTLVIVTTMGMLALSGCTQISDALHHESTVSFSSTKSLDQNWNRKASWVPSGGTHILIHEASSAPSAILAVRSKKSLNTSECKKSVRRSGPVFSQPWAPKNAFVQNAYICGDWDVIATKSGWFGWTPNSPDERAAVK